MEVYIDRKEGDHFIRKFSHETRNEELVWHRDRESRKIEVLSGTGWMVQLDEEIPFELISGSKLEIPKEVYHRLHRGIDDLIVKITEYK